MFISKLDRIILLYTWTYIIHVVNFHSICGLMANGFVRVARNTENLIIIVNK